MGLNFEEHIQIYIYIYIYVYLSKVIERPCCYLMITQRVLSYVQRFTQKLYRTAIVFKSLIRCSQVVHQSSCERMVSQEL